METRVEINEAHLGHFAHREDAEKVIAFLRGLGWNAVYTDSQHGSWRFATRREENAFGINLDQAMEGLGLAGSINVKWGCSCSYDDRCSCGMSRGRRYRSRPVFARKQEGRPALRDLYGRELRERMEEHYPGIGWWIERNVDSLYAALAYGLEWEEKSGMASATGLWLSRHTLEPQLVTYDRCLEQLDQLVGAAVDDAAMSEHLARRGLDLSQLPRCAICGFLVGVGCEC